jgi:hypothetical protein
MVPQTEHRPASLLPRREHAPPRCCSPESALLLSSSWAAVTIYGIFNPAASTTRRASPSRPLPCLPWPRHPPFLHLAQLPPAVDNTQALVPPVIPYESCPPSSPSRALCARHVFPKPSTSSPSRKTAYFRRSRCPLPSIAQVPVHDPPLARL